jgi:hypothetical protein
MRISKYKSQAGSIKKEELNEPLQFVDVPDIPSTPYYRMQTSEISLSPVLFDWSLIPLAGQ